MLLTGLIPLLGGLTGLIGSVVDKFAEAKKAKADLLILKENNRYSEALADKEYARLVKISEIDIEKLTISTDAALQDKSYEVFTAPMVSSGTKLTGWRLSLAVVTDAFNNLVRPGSTVFYQVMMGLLMAYCVYYLDKYAPSMLNSPEIKLQMLSIIFAVIDTILFLASTSLGWWFGVRGMSLRGKK